MISPNRTASRSEPVHVPNVRLRQRAGLPTNDQVNPDAGVIILADATAMGAPNPTDACQDTDVSSPTRLSVKPPGLPGRVATARAGRSIACRNRRPASSPASSSTRRGITPNHTVRLRRLHPVPDSPTARTSSLCRLRMRAPIAVRAVYHASDASPAVEGVIEVFDRPAAFAQRIASR